MTDTDTDRDAKALIKDAARSMVTEKGIRAFSMRKLSAATGFSPGTIYYHYPSKADLIIEVVDELWFACFDSIPAQTPDDLFGAIEGIYTHILAYFLSFRQNWVRELPSLSDGDKYSGRQFEAEYIDRIRLILEALMRDKEAQVSPAAMETLGMDGAVEFVFANFMTFLKSGRSDIARLLYVLRKVLL